MGIDNVVGNKQTACGGSMGVMVRIKTLAGASQARVRGQCDRDLVGFHELAGQLASIEKVEQKDVGRLLSLFPSSFLILFFLCLLGQETELEPCFE